MDLCLASTYQILSHDVYFRVSTVWNGTGEFGVFPAKNRELNLTARDFPPFLCGGGPFRVAFVVDLSQCDALDDSHEYMKRVTGNG